MTEIITLDEVKNWCKVDNSHDDFLLESLKVSCIDYAEKDTGLYFIERDVTISYSGMRETKWESYPYIDLPKPLISTITKIETIIDSTSTIVPTTYYQFYNPTNIGRVIFTTTPTYDSNEPYPFKVYFTCGYGTTADDVPDLIKSAIKAHIAYLYENRGDVQSEGGLSVPLESITIYNKFRVRHVF